MLLKEGNSPVKIQGLEKAWIFTGLFFLTYQGHKSLFPNSPLFYHYFSQIETGFYAVISASNGLPSFHTISIASAP